MPPPRGVPHFPRDCATHNLWLATDPVLSADGTRVYLRCTCGARRVVPAGDWQAELARRQAAETPPGQP